MFTAPPGGTLTLLEHVQVCSYLVPESRRPGVILNTSRQAPLRGGGSSAVAKRHEHRAVARTDPGQPGRIQMDRAPRDQACPLPGQDTVTLTHLERGPVLEHLAAQEEAAAGVANRMAFGEIQASGGSAVSGTRCPGSSLAWSGCSGVAAGSRPPRAA